jgi:hypothetical protein
MLSWPTSFLGVGVKLSLITYSLHGATVPTNLGLIHSRCPQFAFPSIYSLSYLVNHSLHLPAIWLRAFSILFYLQAPKICLSLVGPSLLLSDLISNNFSRCSSIRVKRPSFTPVSNRLNCSFVLFHLYVFRTEDGETKHSELKCRKPSASFDLLVTSSMQFWFVFFQNMLSLSWGVS